MKFTWRAEDPEITMQRAAWRDIVNRTQHEYLPLITGSLFAIMIMTTLRDFMFAREFASTWLYFIEYFSVSLSLLIWVAAIVKLIPARYAHPATFISLLAIGIKSGIAVWIWSFNGPGNIMITLFATGLLMLLSNGFPARGFGRDRVISRACVAASHSSTSPSCCCS